MTFIYITFDIDVILKIFAIKIERVSLTFVEFKEEII